MEWGQAKLFRKRNGNAGILVVIVLNPLENELAKFLKKQRGTRTFMQFSKKTGLPPSTLFRLEQCQQSITLKNLHLIMQRLNCTLTDIFPGQFEK
jgi:predicted transcriptional regulator